MTKQPTNVVTCSVGSDSLLRGAFYAAENAWHFLEDAVLLFKNRRYSNALVLATYCLEDVGRTSIYLQHRKNGDAPTVKSLTEECRKHAFNLEQAKFPVSVCLSSGGEPPIPGSAEERELFERLSAKRQRLEKDAPTKAKERRFGALYVAPLEDGVRWNRPQLATREDADFWIGTAYVAYLFMRGRVLSTASAEELDQAFWGSEQRQPKLPEPDWDILSLDSIQETQCHA
ncbi:MAG TPA: AbiV family abortive infection protein [Candidatus Acidoferrales bacterium]|nr:AbiV family abortive infection protein [Candidatus Acidoferrales bacterium]